MPKKNINTQIEIGWTYCPQNPGVLRKIVGVDEDGVPIIEEITVNELQEKTLRSKPKITTGDGGSNEPG